MKHLISFVTLLCTALNIFANDNTAISRSQIDNVSGGVVEHNAQSIIIRSERGVNHSCLRLNYDSLGLDITESQYITAEIKNIGNYDVEVLLWAIGSRGWNSVAGQGVIHAGESQVIKCNLRETFKDGTPRLDPNFVSHIELQIIKPKADSAISISNITTMGSAPEFIAAKDRLLIPTISDGEPAAGCRVRYKSPLQKSDGLYGVLYLPRDWKRGGSYPLIVEFPGNVFYTAKCYSTGMPEQCAIGYGVSKGEGAIWLSLPFVEYAKGAIANSGWGRADDTVDYTIEMVRSICKEFGADIDRVLLTGFSRGAIACGFIGLRTPEIASLWRAIHACQHFDGDGWGRANMAGAVERLQNGLKIPQFHTDNNKVELQEMLATAGIDTTYATSSLGDHATDMFLDNRASTLELREWFDKLFR